MCKDRQILFYPILLFVLGMGIHAATILGMMTGRVESSWWFWWVHLSMLLFNGWVLAGLILGRRGVYLAAAAGLAALTIYQAVYAVLSWTISVITIGGWILCIAAIPMLVSGYRKHG